MAELELRLEERLVEDKELASKSKVTRSLRKSSYVASGFAGVAGEG